MKFLIVGLGSMGKRRIRCLHALGYKTEQIFGYDTKENRRAETEAQYGIKMYLDIGFALEDARPDVLIISTPPDVHHKYMKLAIKNNIHFFVEVNIVDTDMDAIKQDLRNKTIVGVPSATLVFHPAIKMVFDFVKSGALGKISNVMFHVGQYLPDWHPYEDVSEFFVSRRATGGAREIAIYEFTWITALFGFPQTVCGMYGKTIDIKGAEAIDDTYNFLLKYDGFFATMTFDVVARYPVKKLLINGEQKQLIMDWDEKCINIFHSESSKWEKIFYASNEHVDGMQFSTNIGEGFYIEELKCFIDAVEGRKPFVNTLENDHKVLKLLYAIEESYKRGTFVEFSKGVDKAEAQR